MKALGLLLSQSKIPSKGYYEHQADWIFRVARSLLYGKLRFMDGLHWNRKAKAMRMKSVNSKSSRALKSFFVFVALASALAIAGTTNCLSHAQESAEATKSGQDNSKDKPEPVPASNRDRRTPPATAEPPKTERQLAEERKARDAARKRGEITFDDLKFDIEKDGEFKQEMITKEIEELNKKTVKLRGFILPTSVFQQSGIKKFVLVRDNQECCFGPGASLYDCVIVEMQAGKSATFSTRVVSVKGVFEIDSKSFRYPDGGHFAIYKMSAEEVK